MIQLSIGGIQSIELVTEDGKRHNIRDLCRPDYEEFLSRMESLRLTYAVLDSIHTARRNTHTDAGSGDTDAPVR